MRTLNYVSLVLLLISPTLRADPVLVIDPPEQGSVTREEGLVSWQRIFEVASHPRCANCHVGESDRPMWSGPSFGKPRPHGMNIRAGHSRIGAETLLCNTCHMEQTSENEHGAPGVLGVWKLAPVEAHWFGQPSNVICEQLRDPSRNGNRSFTEIAVHLGHDVVLHWAWSPGGDREPAPYSLQHHVNDILAWGVAGMPCPNDEDTAIMPPLNKEG